jgi:hypothetical protein
LLPIRPTIFCATSSDHLIQRVEVSIRQVSERKAAMMVHDARLLGQIALHRMMVYHQKKACRQMTACLKLVADRMKIEVRRKVRGARQTTMACDLR